MKRTFFIITAFIILTVIFLFNAGGIIKTVKRLGTETYYVKLSTEPVINDDQYWKYNYLSKGYSTAGTEKYLAFMADHLLKSDAYLRVYVRKGNDVISWEEVPEQDIPSDVRRYLN
ncbi:TPA: YxeA family protein [Salmonella enterica]|nr:YxeA family protein [Salmonella enterica]